MKLIREASGIFFLIIALSVGQHVNSQKLPSFNIQRTNGTSFNSSKLLNMKPVIIIYFSPDCDHCTTLLKGMFKQFDQFKKAAILLVSFRPLSEIKAFEKEYKTGNYKNIIVGMEQPLFFLKNLYHLESTPFTALFNKNGNLVYSYKKDTPVNDLIARLKNTR